MTKAISVIPSTMADLMIANSAFDSALAIGVGPPYKVAKQFWPLITIIMTGESTDERATGNKHQRGYTGFILIEAIVQDVIAVSARKFTVSSTQTVLTLTSAAIEFFKLSANLKLGGPAIDNGAIDYIEIGDDVEYPVSERDNTFYSAATIPFVVYTWETYA